MHRIVSTNLQGDMDIEPATRRCLELHLSRCREHLELFDRETRAITESLRGHDAAGRAKLVGQRLRFMPKHDLVLKKLNSNFEHDTQAFRLCVDAVTAYVRYSKPVCQSLLTYIVSNSKGASYAYAT